MSRLRRLVLSDHGFFITCRVLPWRGVLCDSEFTRLARVLDERRRKSVATVSAVPWVLPAVVA
jgi:hypothetical protein